MIFKTATTSEAKCFKICLASDANNINRGLKFSADGNTLTFNGK
jgi:hypothetical protein